MYSPVSRPDPWSCCRREFHAVYVVAGDQSHAGMQVRQDVACASQSPAVFGAALGLIGAPAIG